VTGLIGWWPLHENSGNTARDLSGNGNHGTLNGGVTQGVTGKGGLTAYSFDGSDDGIEGNIDFTSDSYTMSCWVKPEKVPPSKKEITYNFHDGGTDATRFTLQTDGNWYLYHWQNSDRASQVELNLGSATKNKWQLLTVTYDGSKLKAYLDADQVDTASASSYMDATEFSIGEWEYQPDNNVFTGKVADCRKYNRALSPQEIQTLYEWGNGDYTDRTYHDGNDSGAVSRWRFDDDSNTGTAIDGWNNNNGTIVNGTTYTSDAVRQKAIKLNGTDNYVDLGSPLYPTGAKTLAIWFKYNSGGLAAGDAYLFEQEGTNGNIQSLYYNDDSDLRFRNNGETTISHPVTIEPENWNFAAYTYDGTTEKLYLNGKMVKEGTNGYDTDNANNTGLGTKRLGGGLWQGKIDDARIYNRALEPYEVFQLYQWGTRGRDMRKLTVNTRGNT
jgi:hypothetical protein